VTRPPRAGAPVRALAVAVALAGALAGRAEALVTVGKSAVGPAVQGGVVTYRVSVTRAPADTNVVVRDPLPAGHDLLSVRTAGGPTVDCTASAGGSLGNGLTATCASGATRDLVVTASDFPLTGTTFEIFAAYRLRPGQSASMNGVQVTCGVANTACGSASATAQVGVAGARLTKAFNVPSTTPGSRVELTLTLTVDAPSDVVGFVLRDALPAGLTVDEIVPPVPATFTLGPTVTVTPTGPLAPNQPYAFTLRATVASDVAPGATLRNTAEALPPGGAALRSNEAQLPITAQAASATLAKSAARARVRLGESFDWTLTARPGAQPEPGPLTIRDPLDAALRLDAVRVDGRALACAEQPIPIGVGSATLRCEGAAGSGGRVVVVELPAGDALAAPLQLGLTTTTLPGGPALLTNAATLTQANGATTSASATVTLDGATPGAPSLSLTAGKLLAEKGDLVPFHATITVPRGAMPLDAARVSLRGTPGLRATEVRLRLPDGQLRLERLVEENGALQISVGPIPSGGTAVVEVRARLLGRAEPGRKETLSAQLWESGARLAGASADVRVLASAEFDLATIVGTVYRDENRNGVRDRGEPGISGALVVLDDGLQATTDARGQYHLAGVMPAGGPAGARAFGDRALKLARHTLPPGARLTTDETRVVPLSPGALVQIDFGVDVPAPEAPLPRPLASGASTPAGPAVRFTEGGGLLFALTGVAAPGARVLVCPTAPPATTPTCAEAVVDRKSGAWRVEIPLERGRTRLGVVTAWPDGRVTVGARDVFQLPRAEGGTLVVPRDEEPRAVLRFPAAPLADPSFLLEGRLLGGAASPALAALEIAGQRVAPDARGRIEVRLRLPGEGAAIPVAIRFADGVAARFDQRQEARGDFVLLVGLAEGKLGYVVRDGAAGQSGLFAAGRVKLYAKGRIQGRWLIEGGLDLDSTAIDSWRDLFRGDPQRVFRNLDPDRFYTVYGDASQTTAAAQSRARLYVKLEIEGAQLLFGNFQTGLTGVEFGRYSRAVTGGRISYARASTEPPGPDGRPRPPTTQVILFGAWLQTAQAHDELRGTGGSLYYLSHKNIVEGSEQVRIELRDQISNRPQSNAAQRATVDYEIDYLAGRVLLREPLQTVAPTPTLVRSGILDGDRPTLVVDYEYIVDGDVDEGTLGARATQKLGPVRIGATIVNELRSGSGYTLLGGDVAIDLKKYGAIVAEYARSYGTLTSFARSDDGGLRWVAGPGDTQAAARDRQGNAWKVEADLQFLGDRLRLRPYARGIDQGYTDTAHAQEAGFVQWGAEVEARVWKLSLRAHYDERRFEQLQFDAAGAPLLAGGAQLSRRLTRRDIGGDLGGSFGRVTLRLGVRSERLEDDGGAESALTGARTAIGARINVRVVPRLTLYALGQYAVEKSGAGLLGRDNSLGALGLVAQLPWALALQAEGSGGVAGFGGLLGLRSEPVAGRVLYGTVTLSQDRDDRLSATVAAGGRERLLDRNGNARATLFAEDQFRDGPVELGGRAHVIATGVDLPVWRRLVLGATFERGTVAPSGTPFAGAPPIERTAGTAYASWAGERVRAQLRAEVRADTTPATAPGLPMSDPNAVDKTALSWLVSGMTTLRLHPDLTIRAKIFFARAADTASNGTLARSSEASLGFAWRPSFTDRISLFGRYTFLDEFSPAQQARAGAIDPASGLPIVGREQSHVASIASDGRLFWRFSLGEKLALKYRTEPTTGTSALLLLWVNRLAFHVTNRWDAVVEYRLLAVPGATLTHGAAIEANVILVKHLRLGAGWNFADFGDNEITLARGSENGFYLKAQGFY